MFIDVSHRNRTVALSAFWHASVSLSIRFRAQKQFVGTHNAFWLQLNFDLPHFVVIVLIHEMDSTQRKFDHDKWMS
jgi:hypothetical protein